MFTDKQRKQLVRISQGMQELIESVRQPPTSKAAPAAHARKRRSGKELVAFQKMLAAERKRGVSVAALASEHGVTPSYIYQLPVGKAGSVKRAKKAGQASKTAPTTKRPTIRASTRRASTEGKPTSAPSLQGETTAKVEAADS